jgi:1-acyl-sn-glycerol-3-phosphate acyltransferase
MLYEFLKIIMWLPLHLYFHKIVFTGRKHIPVKGPVILIANHAASFLDAMILGILLPRQMYYFSRSDIFRNFWANKFLRSVHMIPVYNVEHGRSEISRNEETFAEGEAILNQGKMLLVFPEGLSRIERIMLPLKKGTARVALQTEAKNNFNMGLSIIPVGINYSVHRFRADVLLHAGDPVRVSDYETLYRENPARAISQLTRELEARFSETIFYVSQANRTGYIDRLLELYRADTFYPLDHIRGVPVLRMEKDICGRVSGMPEDEYQQRWSDLQRYDQVLRRYRLMDHSVNGRYKVIAGHLLLLIIGLPLFLLSLLLNALPLRFAKWIADTQVTRVDFYTSVLSAVGGVSYFLWWLLLIGMAAFVGNTWVWIAVAAAPFLLFLGVYWWEGFIKMLCHARFLALGRRSAVVQDLVSLREKITFWDSLPG